MAPMEDHPKDTCPSIQALLSEYLDGVLGSGQCDQIKSHFESCPECLESYVQLRLVQSEVANLQYQPDAFPSQELRLWDQIESQLQADLKQQANMTDAAFCGFDEEFLSAYYDGELPTTDPEFGRFESHLSGCTDCTQVLGDIGDMSDQVRNFAYRMEGQLASLDITANVMQQLTQGETNTTNETNTEPGELVQSCELYSVEVISAFVDESLVAKETIAFGQHLEACQPCRVHLHAFHELSKGIQEMATHLEAEAPDLWPQVLESLQADPVENVVSFPQRILNQLAHPKAWMAIPLSAAAVMLVVSAGYQQLFNIPSSDSFSSQKAQVTLASADSTSMPEPGISDGISDDKVMQDGGAANAYPAEESAPSVSAVGGSAGAPARAQGKARADMIAWNPNMKNEAAPPMPSMEGRSPAPSAAAPSGFAEEAKEAEKTIAHDMAAKPKRSSSASFSARGRRTPTSEEYLFNMNDQELSSQELPIILGDSNH